MTLQEASVFFKKRAVIEEEYGKNLQKLARTTSEVYSMNDGKAGSVRPSIHRFFSLLTSTIEPLLRRGKAR